MRRGCRAEKQAYAEKQGDKLTHSVQREWVRNSREVHRPGRILFQNRNSSRLLAGTAGSPALPAMILQSIYSVQSRKMISWSQCLRGSCPQVVWQTCCGIPQAYL